MMRFLPAILAKLWRPMPLGEASTAAAPAPDEIGRRLDAAVAQHAAQAAALQRDTRARTSTAIEDVLQRLDQAR